MKDNEIRFVSISQLHKKRNQNGFKDPNLKLKPEVARGEHKEYMSNTDTARTL